MCNCKLVLICCKKISALITEKGECFGSKPRSSYFREQRKKSVVSPFGLGTNGSIWFHQSVYEYRQTKTPMFRYNDSIDCPLRISAILFDYLYGCSLNKSTIIFK